MQPGDRVSPGQLKELRMAQLDVRSAAVELERARIELEGIMLRIEEDYGLLATDSALDPRTGEITEAKKPIGEGTC